jgi:2-amino-4-hydroxy-6-hydroxymethyldihydropteridine diphosphokinase
LEKGHHIAYLLLGSNLGDRAALLAAARSAIGAKAGAVAAASAIFETAAWGLEEQPAFLNQALRIHTPLSPQELLRTLLAAEASLGRERLERYGPRAIDIDILFYDNLIVNEPHLHIPHPQLQERRFALACMNDLAPDLVHPVLGRSIRELLAACTDPLPVNNFPGA